MKCGAIGTAMRLFRFCIAHILFIFFRCNQPGHVVSKCPLKLIVKKKSNGTEKVASEGIRETQNVAKATDKGARPIRRERNTELHVRASNAMSKSRPRDPAHMNASSHERLSTTLRISEEETQKSHSVNESTAEVVGDTAATGLTASPQSFGRVDDFKKVIARPKNASSLADKRCHRSCIQCTMRAHKLFSHVLLDASKRGIL